MRQSARVLGLTVTISLLLLSTFLATAFHSVVQTALMERGIELGEAQIRVSNQELMLSIPLKVNNTGYYDMTEVRLATTLTDREGEVLAVNTTTIDVVERGICETEIHHLSISIEDLLTNTTDLLFNDAYFRMDSSIGFRYAHALGFQITVTNTTLPWGAPLYALNLTGVSHPRFNGTHLLMDVALEFENHFFTDVTGTLHFKAYDRIGEYLGSGDGFLYAPVGSGPTSPIETAIMVENPSNFTGEGYLEVSLETPFIDRALELGRMDYD